MFVSNITSRLGPGGEQLRLDQPGQRPGRRAGQARRAAIAPFEQRGRQVRTWPGPAGAGTSRWATSSTTATLAVVQADRLRQGRDRPVALAAGAGHDQRRPAAATRRCGRTSEPGDDIAGDEHDGVLRQERQRHVRQPQRAARPRRADPDPRASRPPTPTATAALDFAVARQWGPPAFYANQPRTRATSSACACYRPCTGAAPAAAGQLGTPAYGATVTVTTADGQADRPARRRRRPLAASAASRSTSGSATTADRPTSAELQLARPRRRNSTSRRSS